MTYQQESPSYQILSAGWRDLGSLRRLEKICFPEDAWPLLDLIGVLSLPNVVRLKAVKLVDSAAETMIGFIAGDRRSRVTHSGARTPVS